MTGTAAFEAFLRGRPSLVMGPTFFSDFLGGQCGLDELSVRIEESLDKTVPEDRVYDALARIFNVSSEFYGRGPGEAGERMMTK